MADGKIPTEAEQAAWNHGPCRVPTITCYSYALIKSGLSGFINSKHGVNGKREMFCPECKGLMARDSVRGETFCPVCGLTDERIFFEENQQEPAEWDDVIRQRKQSQYERILNECEKRLNKEKIYLKTFSGAPHEPQDEKARSLVMIDRRIENIIKSLEGKDRITDLAFGKHKLLLDKYNGLYQPITYDEARNSYNRFVKRQNNKIDRFIESILKNVFDPTKEKVIAARLWEDEEEKMITEKYFPAAFVYDGTTRIREKYNHDGIRHIQDKALTYYRKKEVREIIRNPMSPILVTKTYKSNGALKKVLFMLMYNNIYLFCDDVENFFLDYALKHGRLGEISKCPGTKRECPRHKDAMIANFRAHFSKVGGFHKATFYDAAPYMTPQENENTAVHSDL